ncbi:MAG: hypothetical protein DDT25_01341 [Chloroflexi bacterium]|nr:hypothetical protein [Chloroflexota bacterium]
MLENVAETKVAGIPIGAVLTGALVAGLADGIITMIPMKLPSVAVRGVAAWAMIQYGPRVFGPTAAQTGGLLIAYDAMQEMVNLRGMTQNLFTLRRREGIHGLEGDDELELLGDEYGDELELLEGEDELPPELLGIENNGVAGKLVLV